MKLEGSGAECRNLVPEFKLKTSEADGIWFAGFWMFVALRHVLKCCDLRWWLFVNSERFLFRKYSMARVVNISFCFIVLISNWFLP